MKRLKPRTRRMLIMAGLIFFLFVSSYVVWAEARYGKLDPSPACDPYSYAEQASRPGMCR